MDYIIETTSGEKLEAHSAPFSSAQIDELLGKVLNEDVGGDVFWAEYGVTTSVEIEEAYQDGKEILVIYESFVARLYSRDSATSHAFATTAYASSNVARTIKLICQDNIWSISQLNAENSGQKVQTISRNDSMYQYPSSPAVQKYVAECATDTIQASKDYTNAQLESVGESFGKTKDYALGAYVTPTALGAIASFDDGADGLPVKSLVVDIEPVQAGTDEPSPDNVRPISGWTGAKVTRTGKNLLPTPVAESAIKYNGTGLIVDNVSGGIAVTGQSTGSSHSVGFLLDKVDKYIGKTLTLSCNMSSVGGLPRIMILLCDENFQNRSDIQYFDTNGSKTVAYSSGKEGKYIGIALFSTSGADSTSIVSTYTDIQLELGSATDYEPYQGDIYDITFPDEAGTVYGGKLDVTNGVLTVDRSEIPSYAGEILSGTWISDRDVYIDGGSPSEGAQVVYVLATPVTYQLTPTEVKTLLGVNNIYADTGDTEVAYRADPTKIYEKIMNALLTMTGGN